MQNQMVIPKATASKMGINFMHTSYIVEIQTTSESAIDQSHAKTLELGLQYSSG